MNFLARLRGRVGRVSLRRRLPLSFAAVALLTMLVLGAILAPLLGHYFARSEASYLAGGADLAVENLAQVDWTGVAAESAATGETTVDGSLGSKTAYAVRWTQAVALSTQLRIQVFSPEGTLLVDSGPVGSIDPTGIVRDSEGHDSGPDPTSPGEEPSRHGLPNPLGEGLFSGEKTGDGPRSSRATEAQLTADGQVVATVRVSEGPAYASAALRSTLIAWLVAGVTAVLLAALVGWLTSRRLTRPLLAITAASDSMAHGDLTVRAKVDRLDEIGSLAGSYNSMADKMQHTVAALRRFVADAAHELGTPLTALEGDLELAQSQTSEAERTRLITRAMEQAERIDHLSTGLLRLSRLDAAVTTPVEELDLVLLVREVVDSIASRAEQSGIDLTLDLPSHEVRIKAHGDGLRTAIGNLIDNAVKFTPDGGSVTVGVKTERGDAVIWVEDTGIGIPPEDMDGLFGRFHRGRNASAYPGNGLGLAIVQATMDLHGGTITAESPGSGSRFELRLPPL
jgi:signal transduction histidine kinase